MSYDAVDWAMKQPASGLHQLVLIRLAHRHNGQTGRCDPSFATLARDAGISRRSVIRSLAWLENGGLIFAAKRNLTSSAYRLNLPSDSQTPPSDSQTPGVVTDSHRGSDSQAPKQGSEQGKEQKQKQRRSPSVVVPTFVLPESINPTTWADFSAMRKRKRAALTQTSGDLILNKLEKWRLEGHDPNQILNNSTMGDYQGIFPPKTGGNSAANRISQSRSQQRYDQQLIELEKAGVPRAAQRAEDRPGEDGPSAGRHHGRGEAGIVLEGTR